MPHNQDQKIVIYWNLRKTISLIGAILIVPIFLIFIFSLTLKQTILNPQFYKDNLKKADFYNRLIDEGIPALILEGEISDHELTDSLAKEITAYVAKEVIKPAWVEGLTGKVIDQTANFFAYPNQEITLNLKDSKEFLTKLSDGLMLFEQMIPTCNEAEQGSAASLGCSKMGNNINEIKQDLQGIRQKITQIHLGVVKLDQDVKKAGSFIQGIRGFVRDINLYFWISLILLLILIGLIVLLESGDIPFMVKAISLPLAVGSLIALIVAWLMQFLVPKDYPINNLPVAMQNIINDVLKINIAGIFRCLEIASGIILGIFLVLYIVVLVLEKKDFKFFGRRP